MIKNGSSTQNNEIYYYHLDQLGTPICLTDSAGQQVWRESVDVFGKELNTEQANDTEIVIQQATKNIIENPLRFQGQYFDEESNLHYNRFRYYDPKQQRFINQDPIGLVGGINHYQYAPNPVNYVDPLGLLCKEGQAKVAKAISDNGNIPAELEAKLIAITQLEDSGYTADEMIDNINTGTIENLIPKISEVSPIKVNWGESAPEGIEVKDPRDYPVGKIIYETLIAKDMEPDLALTISRELLESGSAEPKIVTLQPGDKLYKLVPKNSGPPNENSPYFMTLEMLDTLPSDTESAGSLLGLPQVPVEYDIYEINAEEIVNVYQSKIAPFSVNNDRYRREGGGIHG